MTVTIDPLHKLVYMHIRAGLLTMVVRPESHGIMFLFEIYPFAPVLTAQEPIFPNLLLCAHRRPPEYPRPRRGPRDFDNGLSSDRKGFLLAP